MNEFLHKNKIKLIVALIAILFTVYIVYGINEHTVIPDHIHSIDDKAPEDRTDSDNITILERTLQKDPDNVIVLVELSDLYIKTNNEKSAKETLERILEIDPINEEAKARLKQLD